MCSASLLAYIHTTGKMLQQQGASLRIHAVMIWIVRIESYALEVANSDILSYMHILSS